MLTCPHCRTTVELTKLKHPSLFANYRRCPACAEAFTVDSKTKLRQGFAILIALVALVFTVLMYFEGSAWLFHSLVSYAMLAGLIWWGNKRVALVPYHGNISPPDG